ncbi:MAG: response regulator transcription factor [Proteobacteria bacterium]|nr:response regulator transcription factor [Pseudomonadota bacterium]
MRVLLIEDDAQLQRRLEAGLTSAGFTVEAVGDGSDGLALGQREEFDAVILDLGLPSISGMEVLKGWRAKGRHMPVLVLTARESWKDKVDGLNAGADDYVTKPFHIAEVVARLHALLRRRSGASSPLLRQKDIVLDMAAGKVTRAGAPVELTAREMRMLAYFMHRPGRLISQTELADHLYTMSEERESNTIEVYISRLRRKLGPDAITTLRGLGYRMD